MPKDPWQDKLQSILKPKSQEQRAKVAIVGIGNTLQGDDAAGVETAHELSLLIDDCEYVIVVNAGSAPENLTGVLRRFDPDWVLLIDAAEMDAEPGTLRWLDWSETSGISASSHTLPLSVLSRYLVEELKCEVALLGIQPQALSFGGPLSGPVQHAVDQIVAEICVLLG
ncbi:MAG: hydrogenase maturation peptidase HycI [Anaerolineae bacterium]|nr:hydrogenase maturation peptidase HycI [Anaerolineae bacterium]